MVETPGGATGRKHAPGAEDELLTGDEKSMIAHGGCEDAAVERERRRLPETAAETARRRRSVMAVWVMRVGVWRYRVLHLYFSPWIEN
jgi:hypothetical protein